jgi:hypothetical protein
MSIRGYTMKKIIIIFLIAFYLLSFTGVSYLVEEPMSPGEIWNVLTGMEKTSYQRGFRDGIVECLNKLVPLIRDKDIGLHSIRLDITISELYDLYDFIWEHGEAIENVMDDLYKDPANTYIQWPSMCEIAYQKLKGEDVEQLLKKARKEGYLHPLVTYQEYKKNIE